MVKSNVFFEALFNRDISSPGTKDFLTSLAEEHPYFTPALFFLLKQTGKDTDGFNKQLSKTSVLINNNYWLNYLLINTEEKKIAATEEKLIYETSEYNQPVQEITTIEESIIVTPLHTTESTSIIEEIIDEPIAIVQEDKHTIVQEDLQEEYHEVLVEGETETTNEDKTESFQNEEEIAAEDPLPNFPKVNLAADTKEDTLIFEPLHTTDYFASVGIKLSEDVKPADKLGYQLKSFTEWLKTMKKVHSAPQLNTTAEAEQQIQQLAEKSNVNGDVVTESMADVLAQQGRADQAIAMLEKLSLLNPLKSAYFAAKIKNLKEQ